MQSKLDIESFWLRIPRRCLIRHQPLRHDPVWSKQQFTTRRNIFPLWKKFRWNWESEPPSGLGNDYQISYLLDSVLVWLSSCGRNMDVLMNSEKTCEKCEGDFTGLKSSQSLFCLQNLSTASPLFTCPLDLCWETRCSNCKSVFKRKIVGLVSATVSRITHPVNPNPTTDIPGQKGNQLHRRSSIICCESFLHTAEVCWQQLLEVTKNVTCNLT